VNLAWDGAADDAAAARRSAQELQRLRAGAEGEPLQIANEFAEIRVSKVHTRNGARLLIESPRSGQWVSIDPLEAEALTWQDERTFSAMVGRPFSPLFADDGKDTP
jgi:hypothetical protein